MSQALQQVTNDDAALYESLALKGDISMLPPQDKVKYYAALCERLGIDPYTQPFLPLKLNGKEILYATRGATDQLARKHHVNRSIVAREKVEDVYIVTVRASLPNGREEDSTGVVPLGALKGESLANALMKAETKAKRRATLAILGLGLLDESELETIPAYAISPVTTDAAPVRQLQPAPAPAKEDDPVEVERQEIIKDIYAVCAFLNEKGDTTLDAQGRSVPWKSTTLALFVNKEFKVGDGLEALSVPYLEKLKGMLNLRLDALSPKDGSLLP